MSASLFFLAALLIGCSDSSLASNQEGSVGQHPGGDPGFTIVEITPNPSKTVDAVMATFDGGATTSTTNLVYLVPHGKPIPERNQARSYLVFAAAHLDGFQYKWLSDSDLSIEAKKARVSWREDALTVKLPSGTTKVQVRCSIVEEEPN